MTDGELIARLRSAVADSAATAAPSGLGERLLTGTRRARRRRSAVAVAAAAALVVGAGTLGVSALRQGEDRLGIDTAGPSEQRPVSASEAGAVTPEMAARQGLDGTPECRSDGFPGPGPGPGPGATLYAAFLTDAPGYASWSREWSQSVTRREPPLPGPELLAICWYTGDIADDSGTAPGRPKPTHQLLTIQLRGPEETQGLRQSVTSPRPLPVLAPPLPDLPAQDPLRDQGLRTFAQPPGVPVVQQLVRRPAPPPPVPVDCIPTACSDPYEETIVRVDVTIDGEPLDPRGVRRLEPGRPVRVGLTVDVEAGQTIRDLHLGVSSSGAGLGQDGPIGLDEVLLREPSATGRRSNEVVWTVPTDLQDSQLDVSYRFGKYQYGSGHGRTVGGVTTGDGEPAPPTGGG